MRNPINVSPVRIRTTAANSIIGYFGWTRDSGTTEHRGIDLVAPLGEPVFAAHLGIVERCGWEHNRHGKAHNGGYGQRLVLTGEGVATVYGHLSFVVPFEPGMLVQEGEFVGRVGHSGNAEPGDEHIHFEVRLNGVPVNPLWWLGEPGQTRDGTEQ